jgi:hypothetical protein
MRITSKGRESKVAGIIKIVRNKETDYCRKASLRLLRWMNIVEGK